MLAFGAALPRIRATCGRDLAQAGLPREKVLAVAVRLLERTHMRVGNEEYTRDNGSYGLTTLRDHHVRIVGDDVRFHYKGKSGKVRDVGVHDRRLARVIAQCSELPGHELFQYVDENGVRHAIDSGDVNAYIGRIGGEGFTAKDFRTWAGTVIAAQTLRAVAPCLTKGRRKKDVTECIKKVAAHLGNTPAVCKRSYVHPAVVEAYLEGSLDRIRARNDERLVHAILARATKLTSQDSSR
jgi:DNA topoisomerase-1